MEITENGDTFVRSIDVKYDVSKVLKDINELRYPAFEEIKSVFFGV